ncbi:hypothetical protein GCM10011335_31310 [Aureimonas glaciei]|uniref:Uncharacterized protein n=1 Tax=Aureimonas glaciei TaxID=1776957 RepID=A0A916Y140_9HYPH|nr:hypothetical protein GCM10011335_31310 [Aureimonas glaciei]
MPLRFTLDPPVPLVTKVIAGQTQRARNESIVQMSGRTAICGRSSFAVAELDETGSYVQVGPDEEPAIDEGF